MKERTQRLEEKEELLGDLHDGVGSALANIKMTSEQDNITRLTGDALFEIQSFLYSGPEYTKSLESFVAELRSYGADFFQGQHITFTCASLGDSGGSIPRNTALSVFRLYKESLTNALKHSGADHVKVTLDFADEFSMTISDDGCGFQGDSKGRGLSGMKKRVEDLGGTFDIQSEEGTLLNFRLSL